MSHPKLKEWIVMTPIPMTIMIHPKLNEWKRSGQQECVRATEKKLLQPVKPKCTRNMVLYRTHNRLLRDQKPPKYAPAKVRAQQFEETMAQFEQPMAMLFMTEQMSLSSED